MTDERKRMYQLIPGRQVPGHPEITADLHFEGTNECVVNHPSLFKTVWVGATDRVAETEEEAKRMDAEDAEAEAAARQDRVEAAGQTMRELAETDVDKVREEYEAKREDVGLSDDQIPRIG